MTRSGTTVPGKGCGVIGFGIIWIALSAIFLVIGLRQARESANFNSWEKVPCTIRRFEIVEDRTGKDGRFHANLSYRYEIAGQSYTGSDLWPDKKGSDDHRKLAIIRESFLEGPEGRHPSPRGALAECRVNPLNPAESHLQPGGSGKLLGGITLAACGGLFVVLGLFIVFGKPGSGPPFLQRFGLGNSRGEETF